MAVSCRHDGIQACRVGSPRALFVRPSEATAHPARLPVEGECFDVEVEKSWRVGPRRWLGGPLRDVRLEVPALRLEPLTLVGLGPWEGQDDQPGAWPPGPPARTELELERIPPGPPGSGAEAHLHRAIGLWAEGRLKSAHSELGTLLRRDLRCLAAHACLGFFAFNAGPERGGPERARLHYEAGLAIARLSVPDDFDGVLPWSRPGNRPFLRLLYGHAICLWRAGNLAGARTALLRICRLSPGDQIAARMALDSIEHGAG